MSPLHNVRASEKVAYPAVLVTTGDHDTRVIPGHSLKYLAELQSESMSNESSTSEADVAGKKKGNKNVFLGRIYENAGHECKPSLDAVGCALMISGKQVNRAKGGRGSRPLGVHAGCYAAVDNDGGDDDLEVMHL